ncbi:hypothetical protein HanPI659440_Chr03g0134551 [Helianthus annuus]|nr:hypothetical protein HanPI659440_Chr03g0134551 [Helianthus annuus]
MDTSHETFFLMGPIFIWAFSQLLTGRFLHVHIRFIIQTKGDLVLINNLTSI